MDASDFEKTLLSRELPGLLPREGKFVIPHYDRLSIANIPATIAALMDSQIPNALPPLPQELWSDWKPGLKRVVLIVLDALGYGQLLLRLGAGDGLAFLELAEAGRLVPLTSVFPSTTAAALLSLATGCPPATHGWLAYELYLREVGMAVNAILLCPVQTRQQDLLLKWGLEVDSLVVLPTLAECLAASGITTHAVLSRYLQGSSFTRMVYRGVSLLRGHYGASDLWLQVSTALAETRGSRALITAYWGGLDTVGHGYGPGTPHWDAEFRTVDHLLRREFLSSLPAADRDGTLLLVTADHGMLHVPSDHILTADEDAELQQHLQIPVTGESRAAFVFPRPGRAAKIRSYLCEAFRDWFAVLDSQDALDQGLMGHPVCEETYARTGQLLVVPRDKHALQRSRPGVTLIGRHGGLSRSEMLVPLIGARLEALSM